MQAQFQYKFISSVFLHIFIFIFMRKQTIIFEVHNLQGGLEFLVTSTFEIILIQLLEDNKIFYENASYEITEWAN